ncbi:hypothetical protein BQ8794_130287 [Mesorhizobium prunaredense]|uniref:Uncharacterized protein n=1 Tax=Mesorhizobium prunaredense TaxID=1631249 RepID=A0A1R3V1N4_9HYPH|nr:hypothetical protein BQ8794_130287 [Mesorhizobium prunaredense]
MDCAWIGCARANPERAAIVVNMRMIIPSVFRFARGGSLGDHSTIVPGYGSRPTWRWPSVGLEREPAKLRMLIAGGAAWRSSSPAEIAIRNAPFGSAGAALVAAAVVEEVGDPCRRLRRGESQQPIVMDDRLAGLIVPDLEPATWVRYGFETDLHIDSPGDRRTEVLRSRLMDGLRTFGIMLLAARGLADVASASWRLARGAGRHGRRSPGLRSGRGSRCRTN